MSGGVWRPRVRWGNPLALISLAPSALDLPRAGPASWSAPHSYGCGAHRRQTESHADLLHCIVWSSHLSAVNLTPWHPAPPHWHQAVDSDMASDGLLTPSAPATVDLLVTLADLHHGDFMCAPHWQGCHWHAGNGHGTSVLGLAAGPPALAPPLPVHAFGHVTPSVTMMRQEHDSR
jgi:hypothetical protein